MKNLSACFAPDAGGSSTAGLPTDTATLSQTSAAWLESERHIPVEVAARCGVVTVNDRLAFEYRANGRLNYRKMRIATADGKSFSRDRKGAETCAFLENMIQDDPDLSSPLVICEGEIDALSMVTAGVANVISVPDGAQLDEIGQGQIVPADDKAFGWLWGEAGMKPHFAQFQRVIIAADSDRKGGILREELAVRFERWRCDFVVYPDDCKDANDVLVKHGAARLLECVETAKPMVPNRLVPFGDIPQTGTGEVYGSGFKGLDEGMGFSFVIPELVIVTGEPGSGKSELTAIIGANLANYHSLPGAILQFEDRTVRVRETLIRYAMSNVSTCEDNRQAAKDWVDRWFRTIEPDQNLDLDQDYSLAWLTETIREARVRHGCRWVVIDPWNELEHVFDKNKNEASYTNDALRKLKRLARAHQILLFVVAHPSKEGGQKKEIVDMDLYGISGGAAWNNKADHGIIVHRPDKSKNDVYVKVSKSKDHLVMGKPGICRMQYMPATGQYRYVGMGV